MKNSTIQSASRGIAAVAAAFAGAAALAAAAAFADDGYIEASSAQSIDTCVYLGPNSRVELDFAHVTGEASASGGQYILAAGNSSNRAAVLVAKDASVFSCMIGDDHIDFSATALDTARHTVVIDEPNSRGLLYTGGTLVQTVAGSALTGTTSSTMKLFSFYDSAKAFAPARIYSCRVYETENGVETLAHEFLPALRGGEAGLYDTVGGGFFRNSVFASPLAYGGDILKIRDDGYVATYGNNGNAGSLYFDTGYLPGANTRAELDYAIAEAYPGSGTWYLFSAFGNGYFGIGLDNNKFWWTDGTTNSTRWAAFSPALSPSSAAYTVDIRRTAVLDMENLDAPAAIVTGGLTNAVSATAGQFYTGTGTATLTIAARKATTIATAAPLKIYGFKIYESDTLVRSYEPAVSNGIPCLVDTVGNGGVIASAIATNALKIAAGGKVRTIGTALDAYVEADATQSVDTGVYLGPTSRVEIDFQHLTGVADTLNGQYILAAGNSSNRAAVFVAAKKTCFGCMTQNSTLSFGDLALDTARHTVVIDEPNKKGVLITAGVTNQVVTGSALTGTTSTTMKLFSFYDSAKAFAPARIYSCRVYETENGVETLAHEFVPYMQDGVAGFWDTVDKVFKGKTVGNDFAMSGMGVDGEEAWIKSAPETATVSKDGAGVTITAAAAGAVAYKWTLNGEVLDDFTGETCTATWHQGSYDTPDVYACTALYDIGGDETEGEPHTVCTVTRIAPAFVMVIR